MSDFWCWLLLLTVVDVTAVMCARMGVDHSGGYTVFSVLCFALCGYLLIPLMAYHSTAVISLFWVSFSTGVVTVLCYLLFDEKMSKKQMLGLLITVVGILIIDLA